MPLAAAESIHGPQVEAADSTPNGSGCEHTMHLYLVWNKYAAGAQQTFPSVRGESQQSVTLRPQLELLGEHRVHPRKPQASCVKICVLCTRWQHVHVHPVRVVVWLRARAMRASNAGPVLRHRNTWPKRRRAWQNQVPTLWDPRRYAPAGRTPGAEAAREAKGFRKATRRLACSRASRQRPYQLAFPGVALEIEVGRTRPCVPVWFQCSRRRAPPP